MKLYCIKSHASGTGGAIPPYAFKRLTLVSNENRIKEDTNMIYDKLSKYVRENEAIPACRKYVVYMTIKQAFIDIAKSDYKYLCYTINGTSDSTGQCAITCEYARELLKYSEEDMNTIIEVMCVEHITELQGGMIVL